MLRWLVRIVTIGLLLMALCFLPDQVWAEPQKWAVVIGIGKYQDSRIRPLKYFWILNSDPV